MSLCSLLSPRSGFRCCCAAPPPPAQPHQEARGGLVELPDARGGEKTLSNFRPPSRPLPGGTGAPQPNKVRKGWSLPLAGRPREHKEAGAGAGEVYPRSQPVVSSILHVQHYNSRAIVRMGRTPTTFRSFGPAGRTHRSFFF